MARIVTAFGLALLASCATPMAPTRSVVVGGDTFAYNAYEGSYSRFLDNQFVEPGPNGAGYRPALVVTIVSRNGAPLSEADRDAARAAARVICIGTSRRFFDGEDGVFLPGGGLSFAGACG